MEVKRPFLDSIYSKLERKTCSKKNRKRGGQKGPRQEMLEPTQRIPIRPETCACGNHHLALKKMKPFSVYTHQQIELPEIKVDVLHFHIRSIACSNSCFDMYPAKSKKSIIFFSSEMGPTYTLL